MRLEQPGNDDPVRMQLTGDWVATVAAVRPGEIDVAHEVQSARVTGGGVANASAAEVEKLRQRLGRRFWVTYRDDGAAPARYARCGHDARAPSTPRAVHR